mgnify:CR=1 FL=1
MPNMFEVVEETEGDVAAMERALREGATVEDTDSPYCLALLGMMARQVRG